MARRGSGEGTIYRRKCDGIYVAALVVDGQRKYFYSKRRADVVRRLDEARRNSSQGLPVVPGSEGTGPYLRAWVDGLRSAIRPTTWDAYDRCVRAAIPAIGGIPLSKLQPQHLQAFYEARLRAGSSAATVNQVHRVLRTALSQAERWGLVPRNVAALATPPRAAERPMAVLSEEQVRTLLDAAAGHRLEALFVLAVTTGMRSGELLGLRWRDVDLVHGNLSVSSTLHRVSRRFRDADAPARPGGALKSLEIGEPKTDRSRRSILLTSVAREALARHRVARSLVCLTAADDLVFPTLEGRPMDRERLNRRHFLPLLERARIPRIRFHDLRHTAATLMIQRGVHIRVVADILGHSDPAITMRVYGHVVPAMHEAAVAAMEAVVLQQPLQHQGGGQGRRLADTDG